MTKGIVAATAALAFFLFAGVASAQYPPPGGSLLCEIQASVQITGGSRVAATLRDFSGRPVAGQIVTFFIASQPGGAALSTNTAVTNAAGIASVDLRLGANPGRIVVGAITADLQCSAIVDIVSAVSFQPVAQIGAFVFTPPTTGDAGLLAPREGVPFDRQLVVGAVLGLFLIAGAFAALVGRGSAR